MISWTDQGTTESRTESVTVSAVVEKPLTPVRLRCAPEDVGDRLISSRHTARHVLTENGRQRSQRLNELQSAPKWHCGIQIRHNFAGLSLLHGGCFDRCASSAFDLAESPTIRPSVGSAPVVCAHAVIHHVKLVHDLPQKHCPWRFLSPSGVPGQT